VNSDLVIIVSGRFLQTITQVFVLRLMTARLEPNEMGKFALITSITAFFALIFIYPVGMYINRRLHDWADQGLILLRFRQGFIYLLFVVGFAMLVINLGLIFREVSWGIERYWLVVLVGGSLLFNTANQTVIPALNVLGHRKLWVIYTLVTLWSGLIIAMLLTSQNRTVELWLVGQQIGLLIGSLISTISFWRLIKVKGIQIAPKDWNVNTIRPIFSFIIPVALAISLNWVQFQSYRFVLNNIAGLEYLGLFVAGYTLSAGIMNAFESTAISYFYPLFYKNITGISDKEKIAVWNGYAAVMFPLTIFTAVFIIVMSKQLSHILMDNSFWRAIDFVMIGAIVEMGRVLGNVYSMAAHATMNTKTLVKPQIIGSISVLILVVLLTKLLSVDGVGIALVLSSLLYVISMHWYMHKHFAIKVNFRRMGINIVMAIPLLAVAGIFNIINVNVGYLYDTVPLLLSGIVYLLISYNVLRRASQYATK
jgi:O-antigen/teichoic acid export membrane protein